MKKHVFNSILILSSVIAFAQNGPPWKPTGNNASLGDFLGTTNNLDLPFKTNNTTRFTLSSNGDIVFNSLANSFNSSFLSIDQNGKVNSIDQNSLGLFQKSGNDYYITNGNLGLGIIPSPGIRLDVIGDARISNNLYVGGGIVITDQVQAATQIKGFDIKVGNDLTVESDSRLKGNTQLDKGFTFDGQKGLSFIPQTATDPNIFNYGNAVGKIPTVCAAQPATWANHTFGGILQIFDADPLTGAYKPNSGLLNMQAWTGGCSIDASIGGQAAPIGGLLLNYFCGNNTFINTGAYGGTVFLGTTVIGPQKQTSGPHTDARLMVDGKIVAKSAYVKIVDWADYVFSDNYKLASLNEVESYYKSNKHLPEIPSEKEVVENGIDIAEMNKLLLKKIEELTMYVVQQQKEIEKLKEKIK